MKSSSISLAVALAAGCAHHQSTGATDEDLRTEHVAPRASADERMAADEADAVADDTAGDERVDLPPRTRQDQLASAGEDVASAGAEAYAPAADPSGVADPVAGEPVAAEPTPLDQGESEMDRALTQQIRKAVVHDSSLSMRAKNVKIITRDGRVTLRGSVVSGRERETLERLAKSAAGPAMVTSQLEVSAVEGRGPAREQNKH